MSNANLPANIANMVTGLAQSVETVKSATGQLFMKMTKGGVFVYGQEEIETEEESIWAANPAGFLHGWTAWGDKAHGTAGKNLGEHLGPAAQPIFPEANLEAVEGSWSQAIGIQFYCTNGEDEGTQVLFKSNSLGGRKAYAALLAEVVAKIQEGVADFVPLVKLESDSYKHDEYGKIYFPEFTIVGWTTMDDPSIAAAEEEEEEEEEETEEEAPPEEPPKKPRKRRSRAAKAAAEADAGEAEDVEEEEEEDGDEPPPPPRRRRRRKTS